MNKHTPGPWHWVPYNRDTKDMPALVTEDGAIICHFGNDKQYYPSAGAEPNEFNSALMEAAPDLLAACKEALYEDCGLACAPQLRAAIAKARGGQ